jgi:hypothetical protein
MIKTCIFCKKIFEVSSGPNLTKKIFCNTHCQQEYWRFKRNKTGNFNRRESLKKANIIRKNNHLTEKQLELCYGTLLGDASISPRNGSCRIKITHCNKQKDYLSWKKDLLYPFIIQSSLTSEENPWSKNSLFSFTSIVHHDFSLLYSLFYRNNRKKRNKFINMKILNLLTPFSLLFWYLDDGCLTKDKEVRFAINCFSISEVKTIKKWFWKRYKIETIIATNKEKNSYFLRINVKNSQKFFHLINIFKEQVPKCMYYKFIN